MGRLPGGVHWRGGEGGAYYKTVSREGKRRRVRLGRTVDEAQRTLALLLSERRAPSETTVAAAAERWLAEHVARLRNPKGQRLATKRAREYLVPHMGARKIASVSAEHLRAYALALTRLEWREGRRLSVQTVAHVLSDARSLFLWATDAGIIDRCPVPRRLLPRVPQSLPEPFTTEERATLVSLPGADGLAVRIALSSGLRWGELVALQARDVRDGVLTIVAPKTGRIRRVPLSEPMARELSGRVGRLFPFVYGQLGAFTKRVRRRSGIVGFHVHRMRDDFACRWLEGGGSLAALQTLLGHSTPLVTMRYGALSGDAIAREAERVYGIEGLIGTKKGTKAAEDGR